MKKIRQTTIGFLTLFYLCLPFVGHAQVTSSSYYFYNNTSNTPYYPTYGCGSGFNCNNSYYASVQTSQLNQTASVANAVEQPAAPQLPKTGGGGRALAKSSSPYPNYNYGFLLAAAILSLGFLFSGMKKPPGNRFDMSY